MHNIAILFSIATNARIFFFCQLLIDQYDTESKTSVKETKQLDHPKHIASYNNVKNLVARRGADVVTWSPRSPWLMYSTGYDAPFKFLDPCSSTIYELDIPELIDKELCHASDGWLVVVGKDSSKFLFNPFTQERIDHLPNRMLMYSQYAFSSSPARKDCLLFSILTISEEHGTINLFRMSNHDSSTLAYESNPPTRLPLSNPVYYNGLFYCLGPNGNLGTFDPASNTWVVKDTQVPFDSSTVSNCFLIKSDEFELLSVFVDQNDNPIGVYRLDFVCNMWREVRHVGDKTLFVGSKACFLVTAVKTEMANKIYSLKFVEEEWDNELVRYQVGVNNTNGGPFTNSNRYMSLWIEPRGVRFGYDWTTGMIVPTRFPRSSIEMAKM